jgi:hypothetical protein
VAASMARSSASTWRGATALGTSAKPCAARLKLIYAVWRRYGCYEYSQRLTASDLLQVFARRERRIVAVGVHRAGRRRGRKSERACAAAGAFTPTAGINVCLGWQPCKSSRLHRRRP